ncbi:MAG: YHS domain-containing protein, partial [Chloroflexi bacterium]|nr:YHS domain-containing protein [Chloroflexota bacterium]
RGHHAAAAAPALAAAPPIPIPAPNEAIDPICGMRVAVPGARHVLEHDQQTLYFCCPACKHTFAKDPRRYLASAGFG